MPSSAFREKQRYYQRKANRLCTRCGEALKKDWKYITCPGCRQKNVDRLRERRDKMLSKGLCVHCGIFPHAEGIQTCDYCREDAKERWYQLTLRRIQEEWEDAAE